MRTRILVVVLLSAALLTGCATAKGTERSVTVPGEGTVQVAPDVVTVNLGVQTRNADVQQAVAENNRIANAIMQAARSVGVADSDIQTAYFTVYPQVDYNQVGVQTNQVTYLVDNNITVRLRDVSRLSDLLQASVDAGATNIYGVTFSIADTTAAEDEARAKAMKDAQARAAQIAVNAGLTLGEAITISTGVILPQPVYYAPAAYGMGGGGGPPVAPGTNSVTVNVTVSYAVR
ncbi:MAG TPA: SIMPL domain-containing protein [Anaerolineales bacterium]|nr:SIMPL domain-containing protein [Anaerolineales bacterium]